MQTRQGTAQAVRQTLTQRGSEATRNLREALHLPTNPNDTSILGTALAEAAAEEGRRNGHFAGEVRRRYDELLRLHGQSGTRGARQKASLPPLMPVRTDLPWRPIDPFAPPSPAFLIQVYGRHQLDRALQEYTLDILKRSADVVQAAHPGTKPKSRASKQSVIDYIVQYS